MNYRELFEKSTIPICWNRLSKQNSIEMNLVMGWICHNPSVVYIYMFDYHNHTYFVWVSIHVKLNTDATHMEENFSCESIYKNKMLIKSYRCTVLYAKQSVTKATIESSAQLCDEYKSNESQYEHMRTQDDFFE